MTIIEQIKAASTKKFSNGDGFTCQDFGNIGLTPPQVRCALTRLADSDYNHVKPAGQVAWKNGSKINLYKLVKTQEVDCECNPGDATIWHTKPPVNECREGESYRVKFWDNSESHRAWRKGTWWTPSGKSLATAWVKEWRGVTR